MSDFYSHEWLMVLAQQDAPPGATETGGNGGQPIEGQPGTVDPNATGQPTTARPQASPWSQLIIWGPLILIFVFILWSSSSSQRKEKRHREQMLASLAKHDKVQTVGGVIGSVVEIKDNEVILKVDEANNIKMRFAKSAVQQVVSDNSTASLSSTSTS